MIILRFLFVVCIVLPCTAGFPLHAQNLERSVTGCAGDYLTQASAGNLHFTVGEVAIAEFRNGSVLSQGFHHRSSGVISAIDNISDRQSSIAVFPIPTNAWLKVRTDLNDPLDMILFDLTGRPVLTALSVLNTRDMNLKSLPAGIYLLRISHDGRILRTFKIQKNE